MEWRSLAGSRQWAGLPGTVLPEAPGRKPAGGLLMAGPERNAEDQTDGQEGDLLDRGVIVPTRVHMVPSTNSGRSRGSRRL